MENIPNQDTVHIQLTLADGSVATICYLCDGSKQMGKEYIEIIGDGNSYIVDDFKSAYAYKGNKKKTIYYGSQNKGYKNQIGIFIDAIQNNLDSPITDNEIFHGMEVVFGIIKSINKKKLVEFN